HKGVLKNARQPLSVHPQVSPVPGIVETEGKKIPGHKGREKVVKLRTAIFMSTLRHQIPGAGAGRSEHILQ
ncbi:hypothetical protein VS883_27465, partial [Escherichia coli]